MVKIYVDFILKVKFILQLIFHLAVFRSAKIKTLDNGLNLPMPYDIVPYKMQRVPSFFCRWGGVENSYLVHIVCNKYLIFF